MTLAGIELRYLVNEISKKTEEYYVSNIYGITKNSLLFKLHHPKKQDVFLMFSSFGVWTSSVKINQIEPNRLLKRLRSDLLRLKLTKIEQIDAERIIYLTFSGFDKEFILIGEFFSDGNIILCNKSQKILALLHSIDVRHRKLIVGAQYISPPENSLNVFNLTLKNLEETPLSSISVAKWIGRTVGLPTKYVEHICKLAQIDSKKISDTLVKNDIEKIYEKINLVVKNVVEGVHEPVIVNNEKKSDVYPIKLGNEDSKYTKVESFIEGLDKIFTENIISAGKSSQIESSSKPILELENRLDEQAKAIEVVNEKSSTIAKVAKLLLEQISKGITSIDDPTIHKILKSNNSEIINEKGVLYVKILDERIKISLESSIPAIASKLFDESKHQKLAIVSINKIRKKTERELTKLKDRVEVDGDSVTFSQIKKKAWFERYRWFYTSEGFLAIGGRDSSSNSAVIRKHLEKDDKVFHAEIFGSPFFILKSDKESLVSLHEVAFATVCFSRAWKEAMYGMSAYWVNPDQIKKGAPSGQFLSKGSFVIEGRRNYYKVSTLQLAVGLIKHDENYLLMCGPAIPVKKNSVCYAIIEPTGSDMVNAAKKIRTKFIEMKQDIVKSISLDDFVRVLPAGDSHVVEAGIGEKNDQ